MTQSAFSASVATFESSIRLAKVDSKHSGQYQCHPSSPLASASVNVHVVKGTIYENMNWVSQKYFLFSGGTLAAMSDDRNEISSSRGIRSLSSFSVFLLAFTVPLLLAYRVCIIS